MRVRIALIVAAAVVFTACGSDESPSRALEPLELGSELAVELRDDLVVTSPGWSHWVDDRSTDDRVVWWDSLADVAALQCGFIAQSDFASEVDVGALAFFSQLLEDGTADVFRDEIGDYTLFLSAADRVYCGGRYASLQAAAAEVSS